MAFFQGVIQGLLTSICQSNVLQECCHPSQASLASMKTVVITLVASSLKVPGQQTMHIFFHAYFLPYQPLTLLETPPTAFACTMNADVSL